MIFNIFKKIAYMFRGRHLNRFPLVRMLLNFILCILKPKSVVVFSNRIYLDKDDSMRLSILGIYEPLMVKYFTQSIKPGDVVLDIGAHIGYYTLIAAKGVGNKGKVFAFEPDKDNVVLLKKNIDANKYQNIEVINKAVTSSSKKVKFFLNSLSSGMHSLIDNGYSNKGSIEVDAVSIDDFLKGITPTVIKMDVEGGEYSVLEGMKTLLKKLKHLTIFAEFSPYSIKRAKKSPSRLLELLEKFGFKLYGLDELDKRLVPIEVKNFVSLASEDRDWHINIMAVK